MTMLPPVSLRHHLPQAVLAGEKHTTKVDGVRLVPDLGVQLV